MAFDRSNTNLYVKIQGSPGAIRKASHSLRALVYNKEGRVVRWGELPRPLPKACSFRAGRLAVRFYGNGPYTALVCEGTPKALARG